VKKTILSTVGVVLAAGLVSCTNSGIGDNPAPKLKQEPQSQQASTSCDQPRAAFKISATESPKILRVDRFQDPHNFDMIFAQEANSSLRWSPSPNWDNMKEVMRAVNEVSPQSLDESEHRVPDSSTLTIESGKQSINYLSYFASTPATYEFSVSCLNGPETEYKLKYSTWGLDESGLLDCDLKLELDAPKIADEVIKKYC